MNIFVAAWVGSTNLGDELIFSALKRKLAERKARITAPSVNPQKTKRIHGVTAIAHMNVSGIASAISQSDAVVFEGGGLSMAFTLKMHRSMSLFQTMLWSKSVIDKPSYTISGRFAES